MLHCAAFSGVFCEIYEVRCGGAAYCLRMPCSSFFRRAITALPDDASSWHDANAFVKALMLLCRAPSNTDCLTWSCCILQFDATLRPIPGCRHDTRDCRCAVSAFLDSCSRRWLCKHSLQVVILIRVVHLGVTVVAVVLASSENYSPSPANR